MNIRMVLDSLSVGLIKPLVVASLLLIVTPVSAADSTKPKSGVIETRKDGPSEQEINTATQVVMLGTGTPVADPSRAGSSIAVIHRGQAYLFDVGSGSVHNAIKARYKYDIPALYPSQINHVFLTHLHNDHTLDFVDLAQSLWWRRDQKLQAWGPKGTEGMVSGMMKMMAPDVEIRTSGSQPVPNPDNYQVVVNEIKPGIVHHADGIKIEAFDANHGEVKPAFSFKVTTDDISLVISGDTAYSELLLEKATGVDILFHEVISAEGLSRNSEFWQKYHTASHTPSDLLGKLAQKAKPKKLVLYHPLLYGADEATLVPEVQEYFDGDVVLAADLDRFLIEN